MGSVRYPSLYEINTRVWLTDLSRQLDRAATLDDIPDSEIENLASQGIDWIWMMGLWQTSTKSQAASRTNPQWRKEFEVTLPDLTDEDIPGSSLAITGYSTHERFGGDVALARLRDRLRKHGLKLMLDFVPNHMALDHPWVEHHPDFFIQGTEGQLEREPGNYIRIQRQDGDLIFAHGRDPYFPGRPDTLQLNYGNTSTQKAMMEELLHIAERCDGVRCDMAMLILPEVFERTWSRHSEDFWPTAIRRVRESSPDFCFMAEVYWDLEWKLQQQGFDFTYDKRLYDRLRGWVARPVREHLQAEMDYQSKLVRFLENHDEPRAAAVFPPGVHEAVAVTTYLIPGMRFFHQGQFQGKEKRISPHLGRSPQESSNTTLERFYSRLLEVLHRTVIRQGQWQLLECIPAWQGNWTWDCFLAYAWQMSGEDPLLVVINYAANQSQCYVKLPFPELENRSWRLTDLMGDAVYDRDGNDLRQRGLYLDVAPWQTGVYHLKASGDPSSEPK